MLEIKDLHVHYGGIHAVQGVSMRIPQGRIVTLIGANGAGKSSVIRSISGLVKDTEGEVLFTPAARDGSGPRTEQLLGKSPEDIIRRGISVSPEGRRILPHLTVEENLMLGAYIRNDKEGIAQEGGKNTGVRAAVAADHDVFENRHLAEEADVLEGSGHAEGCDGVRLHAV